MKRDQLVDRLVEILDEIREFEEQSNKIGMSREESERYHLIRDELIVTISTEKDEHGKPIYTNQKVRDAELRIRLSKHEEYQSLKLKVLENEKLRKPIRDKIHYLRREGEMIELRLKFISPYGDI